MKTKRSRPSRLAGLLAALMLKILLVHPVSAADFTNGPPMLTPRVLHTATLLQNGKVLVAGGIITNRPPLHTASAELYDPATRTWTATSPMHTARKSHTATLLPNGAVLVAGGSADTNAPASAELYDPATGTWRNAGSMNAARDLATATLLPNGKVLVAGGRSDGMTELYDPVKDSWTPTGALKTGRKLHTATLLSDGRVLIAGGSGMMGWELGASAELYTPSSGTWAAAGPLSQARRGHTATFLPNGQVLVVAGGCPRPALATAELFDPATERWAVLLSQLNTARQAHTATLLPDGKLLVAGGLQSMNASGSRLSSAELFDPATGYWTETSGLNTPHFNHTATLLANGSVLIAGGWGLKGVLANTELYVPASGPRATNGAPAALQYAHIPTLPPGEKAPRDPSAGEILLSNASYQASVLAGEVQAQWDEMYASVTEPGYQGHPLSYWLRDVNFASSSMPTPLMDEAKVAVAHIGINAIPFLLKWMEGGSSSTFRDCGLIEAFRILGPSARSAIPELARMATNQDAALSRAPRGAQQFQVLFGEGSLEALGGIGPAAVPTLLNILTNATAPGTRFGAISALKKAGMNPVPRAVPVLLQYVNDENEMVAMVAVGMLGVYGAGDPAALAALDQIAQGPRLNLRSTALQALSHFGVQAVPALVRALGDTSNGRAFIAFNMLASSAPTAITNSEVLAIAARRLQSQDDDWQGWAAYALMLIDQQAEGRTLGFYRRGLTLQQATNVLRRLAPQLLDTGPAQ